jgi:PAS domain S-box-containing protein
MLFTLLLPVLISGCEKSAADQSALLFTSFRDIPGITKDEITAIEALRKEYASFTYGAVSTTEAFLAYPGENTELKGFAALFCGWMTSLFDMPFKPALYEWSDLHTGLESGKIDFTGDLMATEERRKTYLMTDPIASRAVKSFQIAGSPAIREIAGARPLRFAFLSGSAVLGDVRAFVDYKFTPVFADNFDAAYAMLKSGKADALLAGGISEASFDKYGDVIAETFFPQVYNSACLSTRNINLAPIISVMQKALGHEGVRRHLDEMYADGQREYYKNKLAAQLTAEEHAYIRNRPVVPIAVDPGNYPTCFYDKREKKWQGAFFDIIKEVESLTGLKFERINDEHSEWPALFPMLISGEAAMVPERHQSYERMGELLSAETVQMTDYYALISKSEYPDIEINEVMRARVGVGSTNSCDEMFRKWFPNHSNIFEYDSVEKAFAALRGNEVDMVMTNQKRLMYMTHYLELPGYKLNIVFDQPLEIKFGFNKDEVVLRSILDKTLRLIDAKGISDKWLRKTYDYRGRMAQAQRPWLIGASVLFMCMLVLMSILFTRSRRAEKQLERLVRRRTKDLALQTTTLTTVFNASPDFIFCKNLESRYTRCNKSMEDFFSISAQDILGKTDYEAFNFSSDAAASYFREDQEVISSKQSVVFEEDIISTSGGGKKIIVETIKTPLMQDGEVIGIMGISRDITRRKEMERELKLQTAKLKAIFDSVPDMLFCKDLDFNYMQINKIMENYFGIRAEDIVGKQGVEGIGFPPELAAKINEGDALVIRDGQQCAIEGFLPGAGGSLRLFESIRTPLMLDGAVIGVVGIARDITQRKEMEEAALEASRLKSAFLTTISHEIRTPMNSIVGFSELALDGEASLRTRDYLHKILENSEWLLRIINDILDISKIESGKMELEKIPFDLHELFTSCRTLILPRTIEKGIELHFYAEPPIGGGKLLGDPTRLRQVLLNLLTNAVKFTNSGIVKLSAAVKEHRDDLTAIIFEIRDSGIGMSAEHLRKVFEPFTQADTGTTRKYGGTGLGLPIAKSIVELMGGKLIAQSTPKVGSIFSFEIVFDVIHTQDDEVRQEIAFDEFEKPFFNGEVLLCEDNKMNQQVTCEHLERVGLKTTVAENGKEGVEMVRARKELGKKPFDLIFMDIHMPVMDGIEAASKLAALGTGTPMVAMTANIMVDDRAIYKRNHMPDYVGKPFTAKELWRCLTKYLKPVRWELADQARQTQDDKNLRLRLIDNFVKSNQTKLSEIKRVISEGDIKLAHRLAHTLKGNAGQLGKSALQKAAGDVEHLLADGKNSVSAAHMDILEAELNAALAEFAPLIDVPAPARPAAPAGSPGSPDTTQSMELLAKLADMLEDGDTECLKLIDSLRLLPGSEELIRQMENFDFDPALATLAELKKRV